MLQVETSLTDSELRDVGKTLRATLHRSYSPLEKKLRYAGGGESDAALEKCYGERTS